MNHHNKRNKRKNFKEWLKSVFTWENIKKTIVGRTTTRKIFRIYLLIAFLGATLLFTPISLKPFVEEGFGGSIYNLSYYNNAYHLILPSVYPGHEPTEITFNFLDSLFMSFSAFTDTGLSVVNISSFFSTFGKIMLILLIQTGGFGIMFIIFWFWKIFKKNDKITINQALLAQSEKGNTKIGNTDKMLITSALFIIGIELFFTFIYWIWFAVVPAYQQMPVAIDASNNIIGTVDSDVHVDVYQNAGLSFFAAIFHSVSVINNAGFDILGVDSLASYRNGVHTIFLLFTMAQFVIGGIGFPIIYDFLTKWNFKFVKVKKGKFFYFKPSFHKNIGHRVSLFTKLSTWTYLVVSLVGILLIFIYECTPAGGGMNFIWKDSIGMFGNGDEALTTYNKSVNLIFQSMSTRSAGYSTFNNDLMNNNSKILCVFLMFIGGSSSSTAGGIRTSTLAIVFLSLKSKLRGRSSVNAFKRRVKSEDILNSYIIVVISAILILLGGLTLLSGIYRGHEIDINSNTFINVLFLCTSAFGTTGLSVGTHEYLNEVSQIYLMFLMFIGQFGLTSTILALNRKRVKENLFEYQSEDVRIG
ncbi:MAG: potassium transporter TrkG [Mycoplasma sp.]